MHGKYLIIYACMLIPFACEKKIKEDLININKITVLENINDNNSYMINKPKPFLYLNSSQFEENMDNSIYDIAVYKDRLFIPDFRNNKLIIFELPDGNISSKFDVPMPHGIAIDKDGVIYICTYRKNSIFVIEDSGTRTIESHQFNWPLSIAIKDTYIIIANYGNDKSGNLIYSDDGLNTFHQFTNEWMDSKPHAIRINKKGEILVVYRNLPGIVIYNQNGQIIAQNKLSDKFDPISIVEYKSNYLVSDGLDGQIYLYDSSLNKLDQYYGGGYSPTNFTIWNNLLLISEERANRILSFNLEIIDSTLN